MTLIPGYDPMATAPPGAYFDVAAAERAIAFFHEMLHHVKGEKGGALIQLEPWQQAITGCIFGWKQRDGRRRYREVWLYVPRKNAKTTWASGIVLYVLVCDNEAGIDAVSAACDREQAALVYGIVHGMIVQEPLLRQRLKVYTAMKSVEYSERMAYYKVLSAISDSKHGLNLHLTIIDETHAQKNRELVDVLTTSTGSRPQPLIIHTTTADYDRISICNEKLQYAKKVRDRIIDDPAFLPIVYEGDEARWEDEAEWFRVNPNLGVSKDLEYMRREFKRAKETPGYENTFKRLELNIMTRVESKWLDLDRWDASAGVVDPVALEGQSCFGGLDLGSTSDLTSFCLLFPHEGLYKALWWHWCPEDTAHRRKNRDRVDYLEWARQGYIELTPGNEMDYRRVRTRINELADRYGIREIAVDRLFQGAQLCQDLKDDFGDDRIIPFGQGFFSMAAPTKEFERLVNRGEFHHGANLLVRWMASNCVVKMDEAGNLKPDKAKSADKIDGIVSALEALGRALVAEPAPGPSIYDTRGALLL